MTPTSPHSLHALRGAAGRAAADKLRPWLDARLLLPAEIALAARIAALDGPPSFPLVLAFALALRADRLGSALVDLAALDVQSLLDDREHKPQTEQTRPELPEPWAEWADALRARPSLVWRTGDGVAPIPSPDTSTSANPSPAPTASGSGATGRPPSTVSPAPFVLEGSHLYTARAFAAESRIAAGVHRLHEGAQAPEQAPGDAWTAIESAVLSLITGDGAEHQRDAAQSATAGGRLQIVTGGPGTGKTYTVRAMLTLAWLRRAIERNAVPVLDVQLAAPTGKAAQRMKEAMGAGLDEWCRAVAKALDTSSEAPSSDANSSEAPTLPATLREDTLRDALHKFLSSLSARTLHRLLGYQHFNPTRFRHDRRNPLPADLVVVDEASMVDLTMMAHLFDAIDGNARLVLVGDRRQLASVETGTVLADLCAWGHAADGPLVELQVSRRFPADSAVGRFAEASERLDQLSDDDPTLAAAARAATALLARASEAESTGTHASVRVRWIGRVMPSAAGSAGMTADVQHRDPPDVALDQELDDVAAHWVDVMRALDRSVYVVGDEGALSVESEADEEALSVLSGWVPGGSDERPDPMTVLGRLSEKVRVLAAHRSGKRGVAGLNADLWRRIEAKVRAMPEGQRMSGVLGRALREPTVGKPIIVTKNDYALRRFNGDVGLWVKVRRAERAGDEPVLMALFAREDGGVDAHTTARLPEHEVVWAMTVHKSQGSEFEKVVFVLPERATSIWSRELVYTGITRVKRELVLAGSEDVLVAGLRRRTRRASGLQKRLG